MERFYTQYDIEKFLNDFRKLPNPYKIEKVHHLVNNPDARARFRVRSIHKPLNFIFMTSAVIIGLSVLLFLTDKEKVNTVATVLPNTEVAEEIVPDSDLLPVNSPEFNQLRADISFNRSADNSPVKTEADSGSADSKPDIATGSITRIDNPFQPVTGYERQPGYGKTVPAAVSCIWPPDTVIDKKMLIPDLTDDELKAIGITRRDTAFFYHNIIEGTFDWGMYNYPDLLPAEEKITTYNKFYVVYTTNSKYEPDGSAEFYSSMDTLVPIVVSKNYEGLIFWFTPHESFFDLLPDRYNYLKTVYENLICMKKQYPGRSFTNYLETPSERVLDPINVLNLGKEELKSIGILIDDESVKFHSQNNKYTLELRNNGTYSSGNSDDFLIFPPNPYPVLMTDTSGRRIYAINSVINHEILPDMMNILVPVRVNLSELISNRKEVIICWYYPAPEFLNSLPRKTGTEIKTELDILAKGTEKPAASCNYFEVCKSSLDLDNFKIYPNPATSFVTVEFDSSAEDIGFISLVNMSGLKIRELITNTVFLSGHNSYKMNLSGIAPGIYLISVNTKKGFKTQRLIVSQ